MRLLQPLCWAASRCRVFDPGVHVYAPSGGIRLLRLRAELRPEADVIWTRKRPDHIDTPMTIAADFHHQPSNQKSQPKREWTAIGGLWLSVAIGLAVWGGIVASYVTLSH